MICVGLTGGIGSGKSTVASYFTALGIPVYDSDSRARELMQNDPKLREEITRLMGKKAYNILGLDRRWVANRVFSNPDLLKALNDLVHPAVRRDFDQWSALQQAPYVLQEAAILMENGAYRHLDHIILVIAPEKMRIARVIKRDQITAAQVQERIRNQWTDAEKIPLADFVIENTDLEHTREQVGVIHRKLLELSGTPPESFC
ncbi:MAG: dephospho-CoA kinase [Robiginitalea sp.]|uniref:dephospho-CoA kinase n=1 Tax=Robiginitalea sp. TaxID=1902411 RepID=UPI003C755220